MNKELENAKKLFGNDIKDEEVVKKVYRKLIKIYHDEDEEKFKEINVARDAIIKYLRRCKNDKNKLSKILENRIKFLKKEKEEVEECNAKLKALQETIKVTKKASKIYNLYKRIPTFLLVIIISVSFMIMFLKPEFFFLIILAYTFSFSFFIKAAKQKEILSVLCKERRLLRMELERLENKIQTLNIEISAVKIALESILDESEEKKEVKLIEKKEKTA